ncbi:twin-arginine translocation signal domain-containing protein [Vreelandella andesensis]|uniref:Twin-arginine translocation signal domain-containing protein n=1 Tax=Vreelandella andesensis TaxID=447567 RepID=A0A433KGF5_9GAMM|nr:transglutaminase-like cysteine peptidase [Halomonas andesensis]RUR27760.1 twin-arginine translocation signal domain-containing protein [Halomonas andesensis]
MALMPASSRSPHKHLSRRQFLTAVGATVLGAGLGFHALPATAFNPQRLRQSMQQQYGQRGLAVLDEWFAMLERLRGQEVQTQLREVNDFFNRRIRWVDDIRVWGQEDFWATPLEAMGKAQGDCEDYSIAKYITLKQLDVPGERLRMIYVRARIGRSQITQAHMVLGYYSTPSAEPLVLDNIAPSISPASQRTDLDPVFSFNSEGLWAGGTTQSRADPLARLSRWRNVVERMQSQGFI